MFLRLFMRLTRRQCRSGYTDAAFHFGKFTKLFETAKIFLLQIEPQSAILAVFCVQARFFFKFA